MAQDSSNAESHHKKSVLLKDQVRLVKRKDSDRHEIVPIQDPLSFEKGFFVVIRACQLLAQKNDGIILIGLAGPSGAGKTIFTEKILNFMPSIAVISMDNYNDSSRVVDGNFDECVWKGVYEELFPVTGLQRDPRLTDYDTLLENVRDLREGKPVQVPIYDFESSSRTGYRTVEVPSSRIVIIEGIYALSEKLRPLLDLRVSVTGGVHFDLVKRVLRDIQRVGQEPEEIIQQISETVYPMYKAFIEPDLQTAHIKIINKFNPFTGFQSPTYILKSAKNLSVDQIKAVYPEGHTETMEQTYDIYLLPPGEDPESCQSYLRMRNKDGKYSLMFEVYPLNLSHHGNDKFCMLIEEWVTDIPFVISPRITFEVSVRLLGGLMALGYTIATILKRSSHVFCDDRGVCVKIDWLEQLNRQYIQVQGKDRLIVKNVAEQLGLEGSYVPRTYIEQIQLEKLVNEVMALPEDLKTKLSLDEDLVSSPKEALSRASASRVAMRNKNLRSGMSHSYSTQGDKNLSKLTGYVTNNRRFDGRSVESSATLASHGVITHLSEQISSLTDRMDDFTTHIEELNAKLTKKNSSSQQNMALPAEACNGSAPTSFFISSLGNGSLMPNSSSSSQLAKESPLMDEISGIVRGQRQVMHQLDNLSNLLHESMGERSHQGRKTKKSNWPDAEPFKVPLIITLAAGGVGIFLFKKFLTRN
ncbi:Inorganic pyrophosphatase TTM2 [Citrus sinensis]|uniref:Inorganic pyrophosphatase TTM2 n=1 Tax=Citrus sinensis TaxID=2711 RepID=A0ACB8LF78_CITSI|nr:Inorganic pyrophosphatase TTM2 [Citrus sinensis]